MGGLFIASCLTCTIFVLPRRIKMSNFIFDAAENVVEEFINLFDDEPIDQPEPSNRIHDDGYLSGKEAALKNINEGSNNAWLTHGELATEFHNRYDFNEFNNFAVENQNSNTPFSLNPYEIFAEIAFTPSETNLGEKEYYESRDIFGNAYQDGYQNVIEHEFEKGLEEIFSIEPFSNQNAPLDTQNVLVEYEDWISSRDE